MRAAVGVVALALLVAPGCARVSSPQPSVGATAVPNVVGLFVDDAHKALATTGFSDNVVLPSGSVVASDRAAGVVTFRQIVLAQTPGAGTPTTHGGRVTLTYVDPHAASVVTSVPASFTRPWFGPVHVAFYRHYALKGSRNCAKCHDLDSCFRAGCHPANGRLASFERAYPLRDSF